MKKILFLLISFCFAKVFAQNVTFINDKNAEVRMVKNFHGIKVSNGIILYLSHGEEAAAVSASEIKYLSKLKTEVENGILKIWYDGDLASKFMFSNHKELKAYISYKELDMLTASAGSDIKVDGIITVNHLSVKISSGSDFKGNIDVKELSVDESSGSNIKIGGKTDKIFIEASSGSDFNGFDLISEICTARASSGSDIRIAVNKEISAHASSGSDISYKGNPSTVNATKSSGGAVGKKG